MNRYQFCKGDLIHFRPSSAIRCILVLTTVVIDVCFAVGCTQKHLRTEHDELLTLGYQQFDQTPGSGWRILADRKEYREAAHLIETYMTRHQELTEQQAILHFHAAQLFAFAGDTSAAVAHLEYCHQSVPRGSLAHIIERVECWNDYVDATKAFLERDRGQLLAARERLASRPAAQGEIPNLKIVNSFVGHFGETYSIAYKEQK